MSSVIRDFIPLQKLGEGSFASVYKVKRNTDNRIYALKKIKINTLSSKVKENALNQVRLLASLHSPYIVKYNEAFFDQSTESLCIVMQYAEKGDLRKKIQITKSQKKITPQIQIWKVLIHLLKGLKTLHQNHILHRDLKCENIMIANQTYKIGDMNVSIINKKGLVQTQTGTPFYASPQVWKDQPYNQKSDIWSLGCIIYELAMLRPPFTGHNLNELYKNVMRATFNPIPKIYSNELAQIVNKCLRINPSDRPSPSQLLQNWTLQLYQNICVDYTLKKSNVSVDLLKTILMPKNIKQLNKYLPKSNYGTQDQNNQAVKRKASTEKKCEHQSQTAKYSKSQKEQEKSTLKQVPTMVISQTNRDIITLKLNNIINEVSQQKTQDVQKQIRLAKIQNLQVIKLPVQVCLVEVQQKIQQNPRDSQSNFKSLEQIQSFNRLIERIKSTTKKSAIAKTEKKRRTLKEIENKTTTGRSRIKSLKRTQRSISRDQDAKVKQTSAQTKPKQPQENENKKRQPFIKGLKCIYGQNDPQGCRKVLQQAKGILSRRLLGYRLQFF